ncbi:MAG: iron-containing alcohol dehydrogenase [Lachnospiraceae bacterium]|nr:iron-containing alcohol dehydrogenase [Lachnospiraceae bacterium]
MNTLKKAYCRVYQAGFRLALPLLPYREPKILKTVGGAAKLIRAKGGKKVMIVTDAGITKLGIHENLINQLKIQGVDYVIYDKTVPNPTFDNVEEAYALYKKEGCDCLIGLGGGSSMDCAKGVGARAARPKKTIDKLMGKFKVFKKIPLLIAIPTTAGTGSEVTVASVLTNSETQTKYPIYDFFLIPYYAVHDWRLTAGLPKHLTATTGMDALTHAVEAYIGRSTTKHTRKLSEDAVKLIHDNLYDAYLDGHNEKARQNILYASYLAGASFTQSYVGYVHGLAHALGGKYGTPHGLANSVILPHFLRAYGKAVEKKLAKLARITCEANVFDDDHAACEKFISWVEEMNEKMEIPRYIEGIDPADFDFMAGRADKEANPLYPVPVLMDKNELVKMYRVVCGNVREHNFKKASEAGLREHDAHRAHVKKSS